MQGEKTRDAPYKKAPEMGAFLYGVFFNRTEACSENRPLRGIALSVKLAYLRMKVGLLCVFCLLQWCIV